MKRSHVALPVAVLCLISALTAPTHATSPPERPPVSDSDPDRQFERRALRASIGRLVITGFAGTTVTAQTRHLIRTVGVGGLVLHASNVTSRVQVRRLSVRLHRIAGGPILVGVTQEPGVVDHLNGIFPDLSSPPELLSSPPSLLVDGSSVKHNEEQPSSSI